MNLALILSDIHGHVEKAAKIAQRYAGIPYVFIAGDITNFGTQEDAGKILKEIQNAAGASTVIFAVSGNCDPVSVRKYLRGQGADIEGRLTEYPEFMLVGSGGGLKRPVSLTCFERTEEDLESALEPFLQEFRNSRAEKPLIVMTHTPPYGTNADKRYGRHVGSTSFSYLLSEYVPSLWVCGHIHESRCVSYEDDTLIVNPGPCSEGLYAIVSYTPSIPCSAWCGFSASLGAV